MEDLRHIIALRRELLLRETYSRPVINYSEGMCEDQKDRFIQYLAEQHREDELTKQAMEEVLENFISKQKHTDARLAALEAQGSELKALLSEKDRKLARSEAKVRRLEEQLKFARQQRFGDKRQRVAKPTDKKAPDDREDEKDKFDGTDDTLHTGSVPSSTSDPETPPVRKFRDLSNRPDTYNRMKVDGAPEFHPSDLSKVPGRILDRKTVKVFRLDMRLVEERFEMVQYVEKGKKPKWGYFPREGHPDVVPRFDGTKATPEFLQALAYEVYVKNVTFGLLHQWLTDMGMTVSSNTLHNWLGKGKKYLDRLIVVLKEIALEKDSVVNCDETWCKVRKYDCYKKCYIWVLVNKSEKTAIFFYEDGSRGRDVLTHFLGDAELKSIMTDGYNAYVFIGNELKSASLKDTDHQVCMAHVRAKFIKAANQGGDRNADVFLTNINRLYELEREYDRQGLSPAERGRRRQGFETKEIQITLCTHLEIEQSKPPETVSSYLMEALNYLDKFWNEAFAYTKDGHYPIDNNIAERTIRKLTTQRNSMLHFGSDTGVEMAATYHSVISTVKLHGMSAWNYLRTFFKKIFNGCRDFINLIPRNIELATANC